MSILGALFWMAVGAGVGHWLWAWWVHRGTVVYRCDICGFSARSNDPANVARVADSHEASNYHIARTVES